MFYSVCHLELTRKMRGREAARIAQQDLVAMTVHRRGLQLGGRFYDIHTRMCDNVINDGGIPIEYLDSLGSELSTFERAVFDEVVTILTRHMGEGPNFGDEPVLLTEMTHGAVHARLRTSVLFSLLRNMMGKSL